MRELLTKHAIVKLVISNDGAMRNVATVETEPTMKKTGNPYLGQVTKITKIKDGLINYDYSLNVDMAREKFGMPRDFKAQPRTWGEKIEGSSIITHKGKTYLDIMVKDVESHYLLNGEPIEKEVIKEFLPKQRESFNKEAKLFPRSYNLEGFKELKLNHHSYKIA